MLHAAGLELRHPLTGKALRLACAPPSDFAETLAQERVRGGGRLADVREKSLRRGPAKREEGSAPRPRRSF